MEVGESEILGVRANGGLLQHQAGTNVLKQADKILEMRGEIRMGGFPVIITTAGNDIGEDVVKQKLRGYQFKI